MMANDTFERCWFSILLLNTLHCSKNNISGITIIIKVSDQYYLIYGHNIINS